MTSTTVASVRLAQLARDAGVPAASCSRRRAATTAPRRRRVLDESSALDPVTAVRRVQGPGRARRRAACDEPVDTVFLRNATAYGVSPAAPLRHRPQQPVGVGAHDQGTVTPQERRHAVAADHPHRGHLAGLPLALDAPRELVPTQVFNVGSTGRELPDPRGLARDRRRRRARLRDRDRRRGVARHPRLPVDCGHIARTSSAIETTWDVRRGAEQLCAALPGRRADARRSSRDRGSSASRRSASSSPTGRLGDDLRRRAPRVLAERSAPPTPGRRATGSRPRLGRGRRQAPTARLPAPRAPRASRGP